jgi:hypothetical protein
MSEPRSALNAARSTIASPAPCANRARTVREPQFDRGFLSPYFMTDMARQEAAFDDAHISSVTASSRE